MPRYEVTLTEDVYHTIVVEAATKSVAADTAWKIMQTDGKDKFKSDDSEFQEYAHIEELEDEEAYS